MAYKGTDFRNKYLRIDGEEWTSIDKEIEKRNLKVKTIDDPELFDQELESVNFDNYNEKELSIFKRFTILPVKDKSTGQTAMFVSKLFTRIPKSLFEKINPKSIFITSPHNAEELFFKFYPIERENRINENQHVSFVIQYILEKAYRLKASDIYISSERENAKIKYRINNNIVDKETDVINTRLSELLRVALINNAKEDSYQNHIDGKFTYDIFGERREYRLSVGQTVLGYAIAIRSYDFFNENLNFKALGYTEEAIEIIEDIIKSKYGAFLITGPTGSGKTTTLYTILTKYKNEHNFIIKTAEDPVELYIEGIDQFQINRKGEENKQLDYIDYLKIFLRQRPDIIMIGEIRDGKVAGEVFRAALTGHMVLSTLHTKSIDLTIRRLEDIGVDQYTLQDTLTGVLNQRLIPRLCNCKIKTKDHRYKRNKEGCEECKSSKIPGYNGQIVICEVAKVQDVNNKIKRIKSYSYKENLDFLYNEGEIDKKTYEYYKNILTS